LQDHAVLLEFELAVGAFGRISLRILVDTIRRRGIAIHRHTAQMDEALYVILSTRGQEVVEPLKHDVFTAQSTIHDVCTSA
jgi:hypothetical protein